MNIVPRTETVEEFFFRVSERIFNCGTSEQIFGVANALFMAAGRHKGESRNRLLVVEKKWRERAEIVKRVETEIRSK